MTYVPKVLSGVDLIDDSWGGMYQGGSYLCFGHATSGRGLLGMLFLQSGVMNEEDGLFVSPGRPHDWMIQASSIGFDLKQARDSGWVRLIWIPSSFDLNQAGARDGSRFIEELIQIVRRENPKRLVINDFSPFMRFGSFDHFKASFAHLMQQLDKMGDTTILLMMPDAVNRPSRELIEFMKNHMTGSIHIELDQEYEAENKRRVTLIPGIGHVNHQVFSHWEIPSSEGGSDAFPKKKRSKAGGKPAKKQSTTREQVTTGSMARIREFAPAQGELAVPYLEVESIQKVRLEHEVFCSKLNRLFRERELSYYDPFVLVALRLEVDHMELDTEEIFESVLSVMTSLVESEDHLLIDSERKRIIFVLINQGADSAQDIFESLQAQLKEQHHEFAENLPDALSAVVVSDGQPFGTPEEFLAYALEGE